MVPCWLRIPVDNEAIPFSLVATIRLHAFGRTGRRGGHRPVGNIFFVANAAERRCRGQLGGKFSTGEYHGCADDSS